MRFNKYGSIFNYYDSLLVGLTATPKSEVDANTYRIFGCESGVPNFDYSLEEAVKDKYLVNYKSFSRTTKLLKRGIKYSELTEDEKRQLDDYFVDFPPTPDFTVSEKELFRKIFNSIFNPLVHCIFWFPHSSSSNRITIKIHFNRFFSRIFS